MISGVFPGGETMKSQPLSGFYSGGAQHRAVVPGRSEASAYLRRVLWLDDELPDDQPEVRYLRNEGLEVWCERTAEGALAHLESESFDVMLLDLHMPGQSGLDVLEVLASRSNRIPVIVLTGYGTMERAVAAMKLGAVDVLAKPVDVDELAARLRDVRARYPEGAAPPSISEADWVRLQCDRLAECFSRDDAALAVVRLLLSERVTLRYFHGCAKAVRVLLTSEESSLAVLKLEARAATLAGAMAPWPTDARLHEALAALEHDGTKRSQTMFAKRSGFSRAYLSRRLFTVTGRHPSEWCRAAVLRLGFRRLVTTSESVTAIACGIGYGRDTQFHRDFVTIFGLPPIVLRRRLGITLPNESTQS
jgi:DNA-binding response OmpR family regulator/AraC-like DNA-binding protein